jgi:hypothetical protein
MTRPMAPVATLVASLASVMNGASTATKVSSEMIQVKNRKGRGVDRSNRCISPVASRAATAARMANLAVLVLPSAPSRAGASTGTSNSPLAISTPTTATSAATSAVARPPVHNLAASTRSRPWPVPS